MSYNKKNRSLDNSKSEAKKIYFQRKTINFIEKRNDELKEENKQLKDRIDKAIQLIENKTVIVPDEEGGGLILFDSDIRDLLETLKGE